MQRVKMKTLLKSALILGMVFCMSTVAGAYSMWDIAVGDDLNVYGYNTVDSAGEMDLYARQDGTGLQTSFGSWCAQEHVTLYTNTWYNIYGLITPDDHSAYLLSKYFAGEISFTDLYDEAAFQNALWSYDDGKAGISNIYTQMANDAYDAGWRNYGYVFIADLGNYQNLYVPGRQVPEPGTMLLLGFGLLGLGLMRRKNS